MLGTRRGNSLGREDFERMLKGRGGVEWEAMRTVLCVLWAVFSEMGVLHRARAALSLTARALGRQAARRRTGQEEHAPPLSAGAIVSTARGIGLRVQLSEAGLISAWRRGEGGARQEIFAKVWAEAQAGVRAEISRKKMCRDREDVLQDVAQAAWLKFDGYRSPEEFDIEYPFAWIQRTARNMLADGVREVVTVREHSQHELRARTVSRQNGRPVLSEGDRPGTRTEARSDETEGEAASEKGSACDWIDNPSALDDERTVEWAFKAADAYRRLQSDTMGGGFVDLAGARLSRSDVHYLAILVRGPIGCRWSLAETARMMKMNVATLRSGIFRLLRKLREAGLDTKFLERGDWRN